MDKVHACIACSHLQKLDELPNQVLIKERNWKGGAKRFSLSIYRS